MEGSRARRPSGRARHGRVGAVRLLVVLAVTAALLPGGPDAPRVELATEHVAGSLDTSFDDDGIAITEISSFVSIRDMEVQVQPDGSTRLLVLEDIDDEVWRFHPDGTLDIAFDDDGVLPLDLAFAPTRLAVSPADGRFVVGGFTSFGADEGTRVAGFHPDGQPDAAFGTAGVATVLSGTEPGAGPCTGEMLQRTFTGFRDVAFQSDGSVVVVGPGDVDVHFGGAPCNPSPVPGLVAARLETDGAVDRVRGDAPCSGFSEFADPRSMTVAADDRVFVSVAFQCIAGPDPVTVFRFSADLDFHEGYAESPPHPTAARRLPIVVRTDGTVGIAARGADETDPSTWNLLRWGDDGAFAGTTTVAFPAEVTTAMVGDMELGEGGSFVVIGEAAGADTLAVATFTPEGDPGPLTLVDRPEEPTTGLAGIALARVDTPQPSLQVVGIAEPQIQGLGNHRQIMMARLDLAGTVDTAFGAGGFALHHGRYGESGEAVAVRPDGSVDAAGRIPITGTSVDPPAGFVLRHAVDGPLDGTFAPRPYAGIKITCDPEDVSCTSADYSIEVHGLALDEESRALIAGESRGSGVLHRVLPVPDPVEDQDFDPAFNNGLPFHLNSEFNPPGEEIAASSLHDVVVDGLGRTVAVGDLLVEVCDASICSTQRQAVVVRLDADGALDGTFGEGTGVVRLAPPGAVPWDASGAGIALDGSGRIVLTGWSQPDPDTTTPHLLVARLLPDGTGDGSFATDPHLGDGVRLGPPSHLGHDIAVRDDAIVVAGTVHTLTPTAGAGGLVPGRGGFVAQLTGTAEMDPDFGPDGTGIVFPFGPDVAHSTARGVAIDAVGNVLVAGGSLTRVENDGFSFEATDVLLSRLLATGVLDAAFDDDGRVTTDVGLATGAAADSAPAQAADVAVAPDGKVVVTGHVTDDRGTRAIVARYSPGVTTLECVPDPLDLGGVEVGAVNTAGATCSATGGTAVISGIGVDPASDHVADFSVDPGTCDAATLFPGQTCDVTITFTPTAEGDRNAVLAVAHTTTTGTPVTSIGLQGRGTRAPDPGAPGFSATPSPLFFGDRLVGTTSPPRTVTATNVGTAPLTISATALVGAQPEDFAIAGDTCAGSTLAPDEGCTVDVTFSPIPGAGEVRPAQLQFTDNAAGSPHMVAVRGTVIATSLELDPDEGPIETEVTATGIGFEPGTAVELSIGGASLASVTGSRVTPDGFTTTFSIPAGTPGGVQDVLACQRCGAADAVAATAPFEVTPRLFVQPTVSRPGGVVSARGDGFPADTPVLLRWQHGIGSFVVTADGTGEFTRPVLVFRRDAVGSRDLQASISGADEVVATTPFLAVPGSSQPGDFQIRR